jgi:hypothetical protein
MMIPNVGWANAGFADDCNTGISEAAQSMTLTHRAMIGELLSPPWTGAALRNGFNAILAAATEAQSENWDGYGARSFKQGAVLNAVKLLKRVPAMMAVDDVYVDSNGDVLLEWQSSERSFTVSVNERGELHFAGIFGLNRMRGREVFVGDSLPDSVRLGIRRVFES